MSVRGGACLAGALLVVFLLVPGIAEAVSPEGDDASPLRVAVRSVPPFAMRDGDRWEGLSVELWEEVAEGLGREFTWVETPLEETLDALAEGTVDVAGLRLRPSAGQPAARSGGRGPAGRAARAVVGAHPPPPPGRGRLPLSASRSPR